MLITILLSLWPATVGAMNRPMPANACAFHISAPPAFLQRRFADFIEVNGQPMFVSVEQQAGRAPKRWILLLHGLAETHRSWDEVTERLVARGYGVVRPDLPGFGRSLLHEIQQAELKQKIFYPPAKIPFEDQVANIVGLLEYLQEEEGIVIANTVGHSMGGALALATAADPKGAKLTGDRVTGVAPYIYRVDFDMVEYMLYLGFDPLLRLNTISQFMPRGSLMWTDNAGEVVLRKGLNQYFDKILAREFDVASDHRESIRRHFTNCAIAAKRGLAEYDGYAELEKLPSGKRYDLIFGRHDQIIRRGSAVAFGRKVTARGGSVLELDTDHDVTEKQSGPLADHISRD